MLVAGLVGGGAAAEGAVLIAQPKASSPASGSAAQVSPVVVNDPGSAGAVAEAAAKASPSVVTVSVASGSAQGTGSGVVLDSAGHILTNTHVVTIDGQTATPAIQVRTSEGKVYPATVVGTDPLSDLAVIQVQGAALAPITMGDSSRLNVGDRVVAIGAPLGLDSTVTHGIVSNLDRTISVASAAAPQGGDQQQGQGGQGFQFAPMPGQSQQPQAQGTVSLHVIQTDAPINPGNSGGALVDAKGALVGINAAIATAGSSAAQGGAQSGSIGVGFSIPVDYARRIAQDLISSGHAAHGMLGVSVQPAAPAGDPNSSFTVGAQVTRVASGSAAEKAGIRAGDVITRVGARTVGDPAQLSAAVSEPAPGTSTQITFTRNGQSHTVAAVLGTASS
jgi:putative serine protease PepD